MNTKIEEARAALDRARTDHAAAMLAVKDRPGDPETQQQFREAVKNGRSAWKGYQEAATAGLAAQIESIVPSDFQE